MKKKLLVLLLVVSLIASLAVGLAACNKEDEEKTTERASNSETIATSVAMVAGAIGEGATAAAETTGFDISCGASVSIPGLDTLVEQAMKTPLEKFMTYASQVAEEGSVSVENKEIAADDTAHKDCSACYAITVKKEDANGDEKTVVLDLYITAKKADKSEADIDKDDSFTFTASVEYNENVVFSFTGSAAYSAEVNGTKISLDFSALAALGLKIDAYATEDGRIAMTAGVDVGSISVAGLLSVNSAKVEATILVGKDADGKYGATVDAVATISNATVMSVYTVNATAKVNVAIVANATTSTSADFALNGNMNVNADVTFNGVTTSVAATGELGGSASCTYDEDGTANFTFALAGTLNVPEQTQSK